MVKFSQLFAKIQLENIENFDENGQLSVFQGKIGQFSKLFAKVMRNLEKKITKIIVRLTRDKKFTGKKPICSFFRSPNDNKFKFETTFLPISDQHNASCNLIYTANTPGPGRNFTSLRPGQAAGRRSADSWAWLLKLGWYMVKNQLISVSCAQNQYWSLYSLFLAFFGNFGPF